MGIKSDFDEAIEQFKNGSLIWKIISIVSVITSLSSIASLSENIIKWKGLIKDSLNFYHTLVNEPLHNGTQYFNLNLSNDIIDLLILMLMLNISWFYSMIKGTNWNNKAEKVGTLIAILFNVTILIVSPFYLNGDETKATWEIVTIILFIFGILPLFGSNRQFAFQHYKQITIVLVVFIIITAINKGLA